VRRTYGFDLAKLATDTLSRVNGPSSAQASASQIIGLSAMLMSKDLIQSAVSTVASLVPPTIPPPVSIEFTNLSCNLGQPLPCMPMVTGHNCFGAVRDKDFY
jgi:hypothetical protein